MNLTTFPAAPRRRSIDWLPDPVSMDEADEPAWAIWQTKCGTRRVFFDAAADVYVPQVLDERRAGGATHREWSAISGPHASLELAMSCAEQWRGRNAKARK